MSIAKPKKMETICLQEAALGFLLNCAILYDKFKEEQEDYDVAENLRLTTPYYSNLLQAVEQLLKIALHGEGHELDKLHIHNVYDLFKKLKPETQLYLIKAIDGSGKHGWTLEYILKINNDKFQRFRYHDLSKSSVLIFEGGDVLLDLALLLCSDTGIQVTRRGKIWKPQID